MEREVVVSDQRLAEMYHTERMSSLQISALTGMTKIMVLRRLRKAAIPVRTPGQARKIRGSREKKLGIHPPGFPESLRQWRKNNPQLLHRFTFIESSKGAIRSNRSRGFSRFVHCCWCGDNVLRKQAELKDHPNIACSRSHSGSFNCWKRYHPDEPRPLLLARLRDMAGEERNPDRLRRMAEEIGAGDIEVAEVLFPTEVR